MRLHLLWVTRGRSGPISSRPSLLYQIQPSQRSDGWERQINVRREITNWHWSFRVVLRQNAFSCCQFRVTLQQIFQKLFSRLARFPSSVHPLLFTKDAAIIFLVQKFSQVGKHSSPLCPLLIHWAIGSALTSGPQSVNKGWDSRLRLSHVPFTSEAAVYRRVPCAHAATAGVGRVGQESYTSVCVVKSWDLRSFCLICPYY